MPAWAIPLILQVAPVLLSAIAPLITGLVAQIMALIGTKVPPQAIPAVNAIVGAVVAGATGGSPLEGAITAHVVRSGLVHEVISSDIPGKKP